ncbi:MAG: hypothetical protein WCW31_04075 [Patescibacteria group bacterium]|jgi:hypothetical protein
MLIICCGPDNYLARQKSRELVAAFKQKHDPKASSIEQLEGQNLLKDILGKLSIPSLFASKKMLKCERLFDKMVIAQARQLEKAIERDADQTVVLDFEDKKPAEKNLGVFKDKGLFVYEYLGLTGTLLLKQVQSMCQKYGLPMTCAQDLISEFDNDLWAIDTSLQMLRIDSLPNQEHLLKQMENVFQISDMYLDGRAQWKEYSRELEPQEFMSVLLSQLRSWTRIKAGQTEGIHPFVQRKLGQRKIPNAGQMTKQIIRAIAASRQSLAVGDEQLQLI